MGLLKFKKGVFFKYTEGLYDRASRVSMTELLRNLVEVKSVYLCGIRNLEIWWEIDSQGDIRSVYGK